MVRGLFLGLLVYNKHYDTFIFQCSFSEKSIPKSAGFRFDDINKFWHQPNPWRARTLEKYATESTKRKWRELAGITDLDKIWLSTPRHIELYDHQKEDARWLIQRKNAYYFGRPGVGKTITTITAINSLKKNNLIDEDPTVLVVCPPGAVNVWKDEIENAAIGDKSIEIAEGTKFKFSFTTRWCVVPDSIIHHPNIFSQLIERNFSVLVDDESHRFAKEKSKRSQALLGYGVKIYKNGLVTRAERRYFLSGTPLPNSKPIELWPILNAVGKPFIKGMFLIEYGIKFCSGFKSEWGWDFNGVSNFEELRDMLIPDFMLYRSKDGLGLPNRIIRYRTLTPPKNISKLIKTVKEMKENIEWLVDRVIEGQDINLVAQLATARKDLGALKARAAKDYIEETLEIEPKLVIFAWHIRAIEILKEICVKLYGEEAVVVVRGGTGKTLKNNAAYSFQNDPKVRIFIGQIQSAGTAITLTKAKRIAFVESSWVPGDNDQAMDRVHRITQNEDVVVDILKFPHDLDEKVLRAIERKQKNLKAFIKKGDKNASNSIKQ